MLPNESSAPEQSSSVASSDAKMAQLRRLQAMTAELPEKMKTTLAALEEVQARLGTPAQKQGDMEEARKLGHQYMNDLHIFAMQREIMGND